MPVIVKTASKGERLPHREAADQAREVTPEELEEEARAEAFIRRMMRPRDE